MLASKSRNRVVIFRLTQDEYDSLKDACSEKGSRNLSEFTRSELLTVARPDSIGAMIRKRFSEIERKLGELQSSLDQLSRHLNEASPSPSPLRRMAGDQDSII